MYTWHLNGKFKLYICIFDVHVHSHISMLLLGSYSDNRSHLITKSSGCLLVHVCRNYFYKWKTTAITKYMYMPFPV